MQSASQARAMPCEATSEEGLARKLKLFIVATQIQELMMNRFISTFVVAVTLATSISGCAVTRGHETAGEYADDATITTRVKTRFAKDPTVSAMHIHVNTDKGMVNLTGTAKSQSERDQAERIAAGVPDVKGVQNNITVESSSSDSATTR
jgi:osmotically-inducible protein OsmY